MAKQLKYAEMRGNEEMWIDIKNEMNKCSVGQMINMYEVHVRDLATYTTDKIEELKMEVSRTLGLTGGEEVVVLDQQDDQEEKPEERLMAVMQEPSVCLVTRDL